MTAAERPSLGVAIVAFHSADVIIACLDSLFASEGVDLRVVVTDNASGDDTVELIRDWAARQAAGDPRFRFAELQADTVEGPGASLTLLRSTVNGGYAYGVNAGLRVLLRNPALNLFWVLNPDCEVPPEAAARYCAHGADGGFALMSGRTVYKEMPDRIQSDGGRVHPLTGVCSSANAGRHPATTPMPSADSLDFLTGANFVASRAFIEHAGLMVEDYFLYYEEVDWASRRGDLPLRLAPDVTVYHHGGTTIGSGAVNRRASPFANYFNYRNRLRYLRRHRPLARPFALGHAVAKAAQLFAKGAPAEAGAMLRGAFGLAPPPEVARRIAPGEASRLAFGKGSSGARGAAHDS